MSRPGALTPIFAERRLACFALLVAAWGCGPPPERSITFTLKEEIPLGIISVTVTGWEEVPGIHAPLVSLDAPAGEKAVAVFARWSGLDDFAESDRKTFVETFLHRRLKLLDSEGFEYSAISTMPRELYYFSPPGGSVPRRWVVIFHAWVDSKEYTARIRHPNPGEEDFHVATVPLG